jgi:hypothetical protein
MKLMRTIVISSLGALALTACEPTTGSVAGVVRSEADRHAIPGAVVVVEGQGLAETTDVAGRYRIDGVPAALYFVSARAEGFRCESLWTLVRRGRASLDTFDLDPLPGPR